MTIWPANHAGIYQSAFEIESRVRTRNGKRNPGMRKCRTLRVSAFLALPACLLLFTTGLAHPGHEGSLSTMQAVLRGKAIVRSLIARGELVDGVLLHESWNDPRGPTSCTATPMFYLVSLENYAVGKTLYLLLNHSGRFLRARFDADFAELKFAPFPLVDCE